MIDTVIQAAQALLGLPGAAPTPDVHFTDLGGDSLSALSFSNLLGEIVRGRGAGGCDHRAGDRPGRTGAAMSSPSAHRVASVRPRAVCTASAPTSLAAADLTLDKFIDEATLKAAVSVPAAVDRVQTVLLTGANGYLGRFLALEWLQRLAATGGRLITLMRGEDAESARRRLQQVFDSDPADV